MVDDDDEFAERLRMLRENLAEEEIDEIVRWQLTDALLKKAPVKHRGQPRCSRCGSEWHGLPKDKCPGSFDLPG